MKYIKLLILSLVFTNISCSLFIDHNNRNSGDSEPDNENIIESKIKISPARGSYYLGDIVQVSIIAENLAKNEQIFYTLDNSLPDRKNGIKYIGGFNVSDDTTVKAAIIKDNSDEKEFSTEATFEFNAFTIEILPSGSYAEQNLKTGDHFGNSMAINDDTLVVGAYGDSEFFQANGAVYVYNIAENGTLTLETKLTSSETIKNDNFSRSVAVNGDTVAVGSFGDTIYSGAVTVFRKVNNVWTEEQILRLNNPHLQDYYGSSVALSGNTLAVGVYGEDNVANFSGAVYVYTRNGTEWTQQAYIKPSPVLAGSAFGSSLSISGDNLAIGAMGENSFTGAVYLFKKENNVWMQKEIIKPSSVIAQARFGANIIISDDTLFISANKSDVNDANKGIVYIYTYTNSKWTKQSELRASDVADNDYFGFSISFNKRVLAVGSPYKNAGQNSSGAAYIFAKVSTNWQEQKILHLPTPQASARFGSVTAVNDKIIIISAPQENDRIGSIYKFLY